MYMGSRRFPMFLSEENIAVGICPFFKFDISQQYAVFQLGL